MANSLNPDQTRQYIQGRIWAAELCLMDNFAQFFAICWFLSKSTFQKILSGIPSEWQTVSIQIRPDKTYKVEYEQQNCVLVFYRLLFLSKSTFPKNSFRNTIRVSNWLDPDQARHFVGNDFGPNCLQINYQQKKWIPKLVWAFAGHICHKYQNLMMYSDSIFFYIFPLVVCWSPLQTV